MQIAFFICAGGAVLFAVAAYLTWSIWIHRYVEVYRAGPALFFLPWAPLVDYRKARRIARRLGRTPGFLKAYRILAWITVVLLLASAVTGALWWMDKGA